MWAWNKSDIKKHLRYLILFDNFFFHNELYYLQFFSRIRHIKIHYLWSKNKEVISISWMKTFILFIYSYLFIYLLNSFIPCGKFVLGFIVLRSSYSGSAYDGDLVTCWAKPFPRAHSTYCVSSTVREHCSPKVTFVFCEMIFL